MYTIEREREGIKTHELINYTLLYYRARGSTLSRFKRNLINESSTSPLFSFSHTHTHIHQFHNKHIHSISINTHYCAILYSTHLKKFKFYVYKNDTYLCH